jgi:hypothetical protein
MKTYSPVLLTLLLTLLAPGVGTHAQNIQGVGINTQQLEGAFHVKTDNGQDVVVKDGTGHLGIRTTTPQAKVDVVGSVQIIDGLQAEGRILMSDEDGNARWASPLGSAGKLEAVLELGDQDIAEGASVDIPTSHFTVEADGYHVYEIRWYATYAAAPSRQIYTATHIQLILRSVATGTNAIADEFEMYHDITATTGDAVTFWLNLSTQAKAGDELSLMVRPTTSTNLNAALQLRKNGLTDKTIIPKVIIKRLNMR